jgi:peptide/nickel transport system substrate-binding protein
MKKTVLSAVLIGLSSGVKAFTQSAGGGGGRRRKYFIYTFALLVSGLLILGCAKKDADKEAKDALVVVQREIAYTLNPMKINSASFLRGIGAGEALFSVDRRGIVHPEIAESSQQIDGATWNITIRPNVKFWSGKAVDADAVIASFEDSKKNDPQSLTYLHELTFSKIDDRTIQVDTTREFMNVPLSLSYYQTLIHNSEASFETVETTDFTGMYIIKEFEPKRKMVLEANNNYWGKKPEIKTVIHEEIQDEQTRMLMALSGDADIVTDIPVSEIAQVEKSDIVILVDSPRAAPQTIYLNLRQPQFQDLRVRQALSWALDRNELVILGAEGHTSPVSTWFGSNPAYPEEKNAVYPRQDISKAERLLDEAGWRMGPDKIRVKDGKPLSMRLLTWGSEKALGEALQYQWTQIGVKVEALYGDYTLIEAARKTGDWDASIEGWGTFGEEYTLLMGHFSPNGGANFGGYNERAVNDMLDQLKNAVDQETKHALTVRINERVAEDAPVICVYLYPSLIAVNKNLEGFIGHFRQFEYIVNADLKFKE